MKWSSNRDFNRKNTEERVLREKLVYKTLIFKKGLLYSIEEGASIEVTRSLKRAFFPIEISLYDVIIREKLQLAIMTR